MWSTSERNTLPNEPVDKIEPLIVFEPPPWNEPLIASGSATFVRFPPSPNILPKDAVEVIEPLTFPVISIEPLNLCLSVASSPNFVEPDANIIDSETNSVRNCCAITEPDVVISPWTNNV